MIRKNGHILEISGKLRIKKKIPFHVCNARIIKQAKEIKYVSVTIVAGVIIKLVMMYVPFIYFSIFESLTILKLYFVSENIHCGYFNVHKKMLNYSLNNLWFLSMDTNIYFNTASNSNWICLWRTNEMDVYQVWRSDAKKGMGKVCSHHCCK